jgi:hypothetical protein
MPKKKAAQRYVYRSAITGRFVSARYAAKHPVTTTRERVR